MPKTHDLDARLLKLLDQRMIALWLTVDCDDALIRAAIQLPWKIIWSQVEAVRLTRILNEFSDKTYRLIETKSDIPPAGTGSDISFIYEISAQDSTDKSQFLRKRRRALELENEVEGWSGLLVYAGQTEESTEWLEVIEALAPTASVLMSDAHYEAAHSEDPRPSSALAPIFWREDLANFFEHAARYFDEIDRDNVLDLKGANGVEYSEDTIDALGDGWQLITRQHTTHPSIVSQNDFDDFLSGDLAWKALSAGVAFPRGAICQMLLDDEHRRVVKLDPIEHVLDKIRNLDKAETDPFDATEQVLIFAESGSGCTTLLRQMALAVAREGYPTIVTTPHPRRLSINSVYNAIIHLQDTWAAAREGRGSGTGTLPVCLVLDVDAELPARFGKLMRGLIGDLHRKVLLVRGLRRSEDEISRARGVLHLVAKTSEPEMLALGRHFQTFSQHHRLAEIPNDDEWRAFYRGFAQMRRYDKGETRHPIETPPLFLIGLYPFVKERVRDERSLEQYLYHKWKAIDCFSGRKLVEILASSGCYGVCIPFESLMRDRELDDALFGRLDSNNQRLVDFFCRWLKIGWNKQNWGLYIRHPALAVLLTRVLNTGEADAPYSALLPILNTLAGTEADRWLAEELAYILGRRFRSQSRQFSLEIDTAVQRAAREIFAAIPEAIHKASRTVCHHHARFYVHILHACIFALENPGSTHLPQHAVRDLAERSLNEAKILLQQARAIPDDREKVSNVINTLAASTAQLAHVYAERGDTDAARDHYADALARSNDAIAHDVANGHAIYTYLNIALHQMEREIVGSPEETQVLWEAIEDRLETLRELYNSRQWRNANDEDTEFTVVSLVSRLQSVVTKLRRDPSFSEFSFKSAVASALFEMREIVGDETLKGAFRDRDKAVRLRALRSNLDDVEDLGPRALLLLYKMYLNDLDGRLEFQTRLELLNRLEHSSFEAYEPYRHDHATLCCLTGAFEAGVSLFRQIHAAREADPEGWYWVNERLLIGSTRNKPAPKQIVVRVTDARAGWATIDKTGIRVKIQPRQFGDLRVGQYVKSYVRFRLIGLQAIDQRMARYDLEAMGYDPAQADWH